jgi:type IV secretory pathway VirB4 component
MLGGRTEISGYIKSIIDNTLLELYRPYIDSLHERSITIDTEICPTLSDFYDALMSRKEPEARNLASSIQMYCKGSLNLFSYHTNISTNEKFIVYDISNIGTNLWELAMQICLNDIWNRMIANKSRRTRTWFYIDEFYLLLRQPSTAQYLEMVWKRARKWMGTPTGITQNVEDLLRTSEGQTILSTSDFSLILTQAPLDRAALATMYGISPTLQEYITNAGPGEGLIRTSKTIVPFVNHYPVDNELYKILSTKPQDAEGMSNAAV